MNEPKEIIKKIGELIKRAAAAAVSSSSSLSAVPFVGSRTQFIAIFHGQFFFVPIFPFQLL